MRLRLLVGMMVTGVLMWAATDNLFAETGDLQGRVTESNSGDGPGFTMTSPLFGTSSTIGPSRRAELGLLIDF